MDTINVTNYFTTWYNRKELDIPNTDIIKEYLNECYNYELSLASLYPYDNLYDVADYHRALHDIHNTGELLQPVKVTRKSQVKQLSEIFDREITESTISAKHKVLNIPYSCGLAGQYHGQIKLDVYYDDNLYEIALKILRELKDITLSESYLYGAKIYEDDFPMQLYKIGWIY